jgi:hypothetical protein
MDRTGGGHVTIEAETGVTDAATSQGTQQPPKASRKKEGFSSQTPRKGIAWPDFRL